MLEHGLALGVGAHGEDVEAVILAIGAPVVLGGLEGSVHLVQPGADQGGILGHGGDNAAAALEAGGVGGGGGSEVHGVSLQHGQGRPALQGGGDVTHVPGEADTVAAALALGHVGGPVLGEGFHVDQLLLIQLVQPGGALLEALGGGHADHLALVGHGQVLQGVGIAITLAKAVDEDEGVLAAVVDDAGHGDDVAVDVELGFQGSGVVTEGDEDGLELVHGGGHLQAQEVQPRGVDEGHVAQQLDGGVVVAQLLDPGQAPDVALRVPAHGLILRHLLKDLFQVGHILVNIVLQGDDNALLGVLQQIDLAKACVEHEIGQGLGVGHLQLDGVAPLVFLNGPPLHMDVGLLLQALEDGAVVGVGLGAGGELGQALDGGLLRQGHGHLGGVYLQALAVSAQLVAAAAACQQTCGHNQRQGKGDASANKLFHINSPF